MAGATLPLLGLLLAVTAAGAQESSGSGPDRLFDAHIHYSRSDWGPYTPERALAILAWAGIVRAIVSSTPDDGTLELYRRSPARSCPSCARTARPRT